MTEETFGVTCQATIKALNRIAADNADEVRELVLSVDEPAFRAGRAEYRRADSEYASVRQPLPSPLLQRGGGAAGGEH